MLRALGRIGLDTWGIVGSLRALLISSGVALVRHRPTPAELKGHLHRVGVQGASTAITTGAVSGLLMVGLPLLFLGELGLQQQAAGTLGLPVVRVLGPTVAAAVVAGRLQITPDTRPLGEQALAPILTSSLACAALAVLGTLGALFSGYVSASILGGQPILRFVTSFSQALGPVDLAHGLGKALLFGAVVGVIRAHQGLLRGQQRGALRAVLACLLLDGLLNAPWLLGLL